MIFYGALCLVILTLINRYFGIISTCCQFKRLHSAVAVNQPNYFVAVFISLKILCKLFYLKLCQYINKSVIKLGKDLYQITYTVNGRIYRHIIVCKKGPTPILQVITAEEEDITDLVLSYMGPNYDWYGFHFSPNFFGTKSLTFELSNGAEITYSENEKCEIKY